MHWHPSSLPDDTSWRAATALARCVLARREVRLTGLRHGCGSPRRHGRDIWRLGGAASQWQACGMADERDKLAAFALRVWGYKQGEVVSLMIHLGDRLGLYRAMT